MKSELIVAQSILPNDSRQAKVRANMPQTTFTKDSRHPEVRANNGPNQLLRIEVKLSIVPQTY